MGKYLVNIDNFQGPLDLLLHLIREKNLDIFNIDVSLITDQYLEYLKKMTILNLDIASEYLVMASYLLEIKSRSLLKQNEQDESDNYQPDNRQALIEKLLEYQNIKKTTGFLQNQEEYRQKILTRPAVVFKIDKGAVNKTSINWDFDLQQLNEQLQQVYQRYQLNRPMTTRVTRQQISPQVRADEIFVLLKTNSHKSYELNDIFTDKLQINNYFLVVTFSAILDLVRNQQIYIEQENFLSPIRLKYRGERINEL